jgi:hypothetical protein
MSASENKARLVRLRLKLQAAGVHDRLNSPNTKDASARLNKELALLAEDKSLTTIFRAVMTRMEIRLAKIKAEKKASQRTKNPKDRAKG